MSLAHSNKTSSHLKNIYDVAHFAGSLKTVASLTNGPIKDFNVMTLNSHCSAEVSILTLSSNIKHKITSDNILMYSPENDITIIQKNSSHITVKKRVLLHIYDSQNGIIEITGKKIILIKINTI